MEIPVGTLIDNDCQNQHFWMFFWVCFCAKYLWQSRFELLENEGFDTHVFVSHAQTIKWLRQLIKRHRQFSKNIQWRKSEISQRKMDNISVRFWNHLEKKNIIFDFVDFEISSIFDFCVFEISSFLWFGDFEISSFFGFLNQFLELRRSFDQLQPSFNCLRIEVNFRIYHSIFENCWGLLVNCGFPFKISCSEFKKL